MRELQAAGRITNVELVRGAGSSAPPRLRRVCAGGVIKGYHAALASEALGLMLASSSTFWIRSSWIGAGSMSADLARAMSGRGYAIAIDAMTHSYI